MGWSGASVRERRVEFVIRASRGESLSGLCREYGISRPTGYLWLGRYRQEGISGIEEHSRRPRTSPGQTSPAVEDRIEQFRRERPDWGARKLAVLLAREGVSLPVITVHRVLVRKGLVSNREERRHAVHRFARERPNQLWQMDFKGQKEEAVCVGPLSVLDDHSRYLVGLEQIGTTGAEAVRERLEGIFRRHGVPDAMLMDHGVPWWSAHSSSGWTKLSVWLMRQGICCHLSGIGHPQTQGKVERFHLALEQARHRGGGQDWLQQPWLDAFRHEYNHVRPHEALAMRTPASCWQPSQRAYDPAPPPWDYGQGAVVRRVDSVGHVYWKDKGFHVSRALSGQTVALELLEDRMLVFFCNSLVAEIDLGNHRTARAVRWLPNTPQICKASPDNNL